MPRSSIALLLTLLATSLLACPKSSGDSASHGVAPGGVSAPAPAPDPAPAPGAELDDGSASSTPNASCLSDADCDGGVCEGQGCGPDQPGHCAPRERMCTRDSQVYCGCDGQTFRASGSCPGQRYARRGECDPSSGDEPLPDGSPCLQASDCQSGVCEGQGCGPDQPGECKPQARPCTRDYRAYCGCDGQTFHGSGSCPGQRYAERGECPPAATP